jgi:DNA-binding Xre family transcriptional regulator
MESIDMVPLLAERGVAANGGRVYRLITRQPKRLDMQLLAALCDILSCSPSDLIDPYRTTG